MDSLKEKKDPLLAYALWSLSLVGICGVHRMYLGQTGIGVIMLFTFGFLGVGQLLDLFLIPGAVRHANRALFDAETPEVEVSSELITPLQRLNRSSTTPIPSVKVAKDDELEVLLRQAEESVERTHKTFGEE